MRRLIPLPSSRLLANGAALTAGTALLDALGGIRLPVLHGPRGDHTIINLGVDFSGILFDHDEKQITTTGKAIWKRHPWRRVSVWGTLVCRFD